MKIGICFIGITRSLKYTIESIEKNIFRILRNANIEFDIYMHTYNLESITNIRSCEINVPLNLNEHYFLNTLKKKIDNQNDVLTNIDNIDLIKNIGDAWDDDYASVKNYICSLISQKKVLELLNNNKNNYDIIIVARPDVFYLQPLEISFLFDIYNNKNENIIYVPNFHHSHGINDRFAFGNYNAMKIYLERINYLSEYLINLKNEEKKFVNGEIFLEYILTKFNIKIKLHEHNSNNFIFIRSVPYPIHVGFN